MKETSFFSKKRGRKLSKIITVWRQGNWDWENIIRIFKLKVSAYIFRQTLLWELVSQNCWLFLFQSKNQGLRRARIGIGRGFCRSLGSLRMKNMPFPYFHFSRVQCRLRYCNWYKGNCFNATWAKPSIKRCFSTKSFKKPSVLFDVGILLFERECHILFHEQKGVHV